VIAAGAGAADSPSELRRLCGTAATLLLLAATFGGCTGADDARAHTCGATDRRFLQRAGVDVTAFTMWQQDYAAGSISAEEAAREAFDAASRVAHVEPSDPSLRTAQRYLDGMFTTYGEAVKLGAEGKDAGERMYLAHVYRNGAHEVLAKAQPALRRQGCDVGPLL
jgi:hypothetical protein